MAGEVEAFLETLDALRKAEAALRRETDPDRRRILASRVAEWKGARTIATREVKAAAERGDPAAVAFIDGLETLHARGDDEEG